MAEKRTLNLVQLLRGVASLLVVFMHTTKAVKEILGVNFLGQFFKFGGAGVDMFFVLSGFIITYSSRNSLNNSSNFIKFLKRRFIRIFPVYWIIITIFLLIQIGLPAFYKSPYDLSLINLLNTYCLMPDHIMINGVSWTLTYELFFYILFSLAFLIRSQKILITLSCAYLLLLIFASNFLSYGFINSKWINVIFYPMNIEFFMGIAVALLIPLINIKISKFLIVIGSILFMAAALISNKDYYIFNNVFDRVVLFGIPSFCILLGIVRLELNKQFYVHNILLYLGEASYSLYLIHLPLIVATIKIIGKFKISNNLILQLLAVFLIAIICIISIIFFKKIENPLINKLNRKIN